VLFHHGIQSHCDWFAASARKLTEAGFCVLQPERRGCGRNLVERGHAQSAEQLIADAHAARDELLRRSTFSTYHAIGVSWGGKLAVAAYVDDPTGVQSLSLVAPGLFPKVGVSKEQMTSIGFSMLYEPTKSYEIPLDDPHLFTKDESWQRYIAKDELTLRQCTAGFYLASRRMDKTVARLGQSRPIPLHLMLAGEEGIIDNEQTINFARRLDWPQTQITEYESARHGLEFDAPRYLNDLTAFIAGAGPDATSAR
jgi:alpha-beta hydrolase superfamily lysophospholipase